MGTITGRAQVDGAIVQTAAATAHRGDEDFLTARDLGRLELAAVDVAGRIDAGNPRDCLRLTAAGVAAARLQLSAGTAAVTVFRLPADGRLAEPAARLDADSARVELPLRAGDQLLVLVQAASETAYRLQITGAAGPVAAPALTAAAVAEAEAALAAADAEVTPGTVILSAGAAGDVLQIAGRFGLEHRASGGGLHRCVAAGAAAWQQGRAGKLALAELIFHLQRELPAGAFVEPEYLVTADQTNRTPNDPLLSRQWSFGLTNAPRAWATTTGSGVIVAVVDTGIRSRHPDLRDQVLATGYDFVDNDPDPEDPLVSGASLHGTHVAGIVAATTDNGTGVAAVGWNSRIMPIRVLGSSGGNNFDVAQGILYAAGLPNSSGRTPPEPARIINLSLGSSSPSGVIRDAIRQARGRGVMVVASAGNGFQQGNPLNYPAAFDEVIAVGSVGPTGQRAPYSQVHDYVDIAAPGGDTSSGAAGGILSTISVERNGSWFFDYAYYQGTSMAAPYVAGTLALLLAVDGQLSQEDALATLTATAIDRGAPGRDAEYGAGIVDVAAAVAAAGSGPPPSLSVDRADLTFAGAGSSSVAVSSGGRQQVSGLQVSVVGAPWLSATLSATTTPAQLQLTVNAAAFPARASDGKVLVSGDGGLAAEIVVRAVPLVARAVSLSNGPSPSSTVEVTVHGASFSIVNLPAGVYTLQIGADRDGNGSFMDPGDYASDQLTVSITGGMLDVGTLLAQRR